MKTRISKEIERLLTFLEWTFAVLQWGCLISGLMALYHGLIDANLFIICIGFTFLWLTFRLFALLQWYFKGILIDQRRMIDRMKPLKDRSQQMIQKLYWWKQSKRLIK